MHIGPISVLKWLPMDKEWWYPALFQFGAIVTAHNFHCFSCDSSWKQLIHYITDLKSLFPMHCGPISVLKCMPTDKAWWDLMLFLVRAIVIELNFNTFFYGKHSDALLLYAFPTMIASLLVHIKADCMLLWSWMDKKWPFHLILLICSSTHGTSCTGLEGISPPSTWS